QVGGIGLSLYPCADLEKDTGVSLATEGSPRVSLAYNARTREEVDSVLAEAEAAGAIVLHRPRRAEWGGYFGHFADPDGLIWEVAWNPAFPIAADGSITMPAQSAPSPRANRNESGHGFEPGGAHASRTRGRNRTRPDQERAAGGGVGRRGCRGGARRVRGSQLSDPRPAAAALCVGAGGLHLSRLLRGTLRDRVQSRRDGLRFRRAGIP